MKIFSPPFIFIALFCCISCSIDSRQRASGKEITIEVDHYRAPCINNSSQKLCYLVAEGESHQFPYYYGEIQGFKFNWGHSYRLLVVKEEVSQATIGSTRFTYRLVKILSDKKLPPQTRFRIQLKAPTHPPFFTCDDSSNVFLMGEVKITFANPQLKAELLQLGENVNKIMGNFTHSPKDDNAIVLTNFNIE